VTPHLQVLPSVIILTRLADLLYLFDK